MKINQPLLLHMLAQGWKIVLFRGILAIVFGLLVWISPEISLTTLILLFGSFAFADGILSILSAVHGRDHHPDWWILLLSGLIGVLMGILTFSAPNLTALALLFYIAIWVMVSGVLQILIAIRLRKEIDGEWLQMLGGLASVVFGVLLIAQPAEGILTLLWLLALYAIVIGVFLVITALKLRPILNSNAVNLGNGASAK